MRVMGCFIRARDYWVYLDFIFYNDSGVIVSDKVHVFHVYMHEEEHMQWNF